MKPLETIKTLLNNKDSHIYDLSDNKYTLFAKQGIFFRKFIFSCPVFEQSSCKLQNLEWSKYNKNCFVYEGSSVKVYSENSKLNFIGENVSISINCDCDADVCPSLNGVMMVSEGVKANLRINLKTKLIIECNGSVIVFKSKNGEVVFTVAALYGIKDFVMMPASVKFCDCGDTINVEIASAFAQKIFFEINFYEQKTVFDTTIESANPDKNNAYGACSFLGNSSLGSQSLCLRLNPLIFKLDDREELLWSYIHIPRLNKGTGIVSARRIAENWCSFATTWNSIPKLKNIFFKVDKDENFLHINITSIALEIQLESYGRDPGIMLSCFKGVETISTGDNYSYPIIIDIKTKRK